MTDWLEYLIGPRPAEPGDEVNVPPEVRAAFERAAAASAVVQTDLDRLEAEWREFMLGERWTAEQIEAMKRNAK